MIRAVIFDMDGLMFDSERVWDDKIWPGVCQAAGAPFSKELIDEMRGTAGESMFAAMRKFFGPQVDCQQLYEMAYSAMARRLEKKSLPEKPGLHELLDYPAEQGTPCAVASSSPAWAVQGNLKWAGLEGRFNAIVSGDEVKSGKPDPEIFLLAARALGCPPASCLVLEDSFKRYPRGRRSRYAARDGAGHDPAHAEIAAQCLAVMESLHEVRRAMQEGRLPLEKKG